MRVDRAHARRWSIPWLKLTLMLVAWYAALLVGNARLDDVSFAGAALFYVLWTLPGLVIPLFVAWRAGVGAAVMAPLGVAAGITTSGFFLTGQAVCRAGARSDFGLVFVWSTMAMITLSAVLVRLRLGDVDG